MTPYTPGPPHPADSFRSPSWRHDRAAYLCDTGKRPVRRDDRWVRLAYRHLLRQERGGKPPAAADDVARAYGIRSAETAERWFLEALLLTGEGVGAVAARRGLAPGVVESYVALFYDVLDRLHARDYIANRLLPRRWALRVRPDDTGGLVKLAAWGGGPLAAEVALRVLTGKGTPRERFGELGQEGLEEALSEVGCRFWVLVQTLPLDAFSPWKIGKLKAVEEALVALTKEVVGEEGPEATRVTAGDLASGVMLEGGAAKETPARGRAGEMLAAAHEAISAIESEYGRRAA